MRVVPYERAVFRAQLILAAVALALLSVELLTSPDILVDPVFFTGIGILFLCTTVALLVPWSRLPRNWSIALPLIDMVAIQCVNQGVTFVDATILCVFPVIWLALNYGRVGAILGPVFVTVVIWVSIPLTDAGLGPAALARAVLYPVTFAFVTLTVSMSARRRAAQGVLMRQQAELLEISLGQARRDKHLLSEVLNAVDFGVLALTNNGAVVPLNRAEHHITDRLKVGDMTSSASGVLDRIVAFQADGRTPFPYAERPNERLRRGEEFDGLIVWNVLENGERAAYAMTARQLSDGGFGAPDDIRAVMVARDATTELLALQARHDLVMSVSHELRTPLTTMLGYLEIAQDDPTLTPETRSMLGLVESSGERLLTIAQDLLAASNDANTVFAVNPVETDLAVLVDRSVTDARMRASANAVQVDYAGPESYICTVDGQRMRQVLDNLIGNAVKYNKPGGKVWVTVTPAQHGVRVDIVDTGFGMSPAVVDRAFERYFRAAEVRGSTVHGTGIGLSISREIIRLHGGDIHIESVEGEGTSVRVTLPSLVPAEHDQTAEERAAERLRGTVDEMERPDARA